MTRSHPRPVLAAETVECRRDLGGDLFSARVDGNLRKLTVGSADRQPFDRIDESREDNAPPVVELDRDVHSIFDDLNAIGEVGSLGADLVCHAPQPEQAGQSSEVLGRGKAHVISMAKTTDIAPTTPHASRSNATRRTIHGHSQTRTRWLSCTNDLLRSKNDSRSLADSATPQNPRPATCTGTWISGV